MRFKLYNRPIVENEDKTSCGTLWFWNISGTCSQWMWCTTPVVTLPSADFYVKAWNTQSTDSRRFYKQVSIDLKSLTHDNKEIAITSSFPPYLTLWSVSFQFPRANVNENYQYTQNNVNTASFLLNIWHPDTCCNDPWHALHKEQPLISTTCL